MNELWEITTTEIFDKWLEQLPANNREDVLVCLGLLRKQGPFLRRPYVGTIKNSCHSNMKELCVQSEGNPIRIFFAFDQKRQAVILCGRNKNGKKTLFYKKMIELADSIFTEHLEKLK